MFPCKYFQVKVINDAFRLLSLVQSMIPIIIIAEIEMYASKMIENDRNFLNEMFLNEMFLIQRVQQSLWSYKSTIKREMIGKRDHLSNDV